MSLELDTIVCMDALDFLKTLPDASVDCCITSPPYYGLRDYGVEGQYGREPSIAEYVANMVALMSEVKRALKPTGTAFFNVADSYAASAKGFSRSMYEHSKIQSNNKGSWVEPLSPEDEPVAKSLMLIPERLLIAFQQDGWIIRNQIVWHKPNPMPESVKDRFTRSYEVVFFMVKSGRYYFDAESVAEAPVTSDRVPRGSAGVPGSLNAGRRLTGGNFSQRYAAAQTSHGGDSNRSEYLTRNKRDVWSVIPAQFKDAHFATFPEELITPMILAGCPPCGVVLDPFMGSGTTALVTRKHGRHFIGSELNPEYVAMARERLAKPFTVSMFD